MKYPAIAYASALLLALNEKKDKEAKIIKSFLAVIKKNGDWPAIDKIFDLAAKKITSASGGSMVRVESARDLSKQISEKISKNFSSRDHIAFFIKPELVAGVRVLVDGERELDQTLIRKLQKLF